MDHLSYCYEKGLEDFVQLYGLAELFLLRLIRCRVLHQLVVSSNSDANHAYVPRDIQLKYHKKSSHFHQVGPRNDILMVRIHYFL